MQISPRTSRSVRSPIRNRRRRQESERAGVRREEERHDRAFSCTQEGRVHAREENAGFILGTLPPCVHTHTHTYTRVGRSYRKSQIPLTSLASYQGDGARLRYGFLYGLLGIYFFFTCDGYIFAIANLRR